MTILNGKVSTVWSIGLKCLKHPHLVYFLQKQIDDFCFFVKERFFFVKKNTHYVKNMYFIENKVKVEIKFFLDQKFSFTVEKWSAMPLMTRHTSM